VLEPAALFSSFGATAGGAKGCELIVAGRDVRGGSAADESWAEVAYGLVIGGEGGLAPGERDGLAFARGTQVGWRLGQFERGREWRSGLRAADEDETEAG
jgi:hypothetical protein